MEVTPDQLHRQLDAQPLANCYLIAGQEPLQVVEAGAAVRRAAHNQGFTEREIHHAEPGFDWAQFASAGATGSLFAEKRIVELHIPSQGPGKAGASAIKAAVTSPDAATLRLLIAPELTASTRKNAWYKAAVQAGVAMFAWALSGRALSAWLERRARAAGINFTDDGLRQLAAYTEGNLVAADQQVQRLALLYPGATVNAETVTEIANDDARYDIFALPTKAIDGDRAGALRTLTRLRAEGTDPVPITWALAGDIRLLYRVALAARHNQADAVLAKVFMPAPRKQQIAAAARRAASDELGDLLARAAELDAINKGAARGRAWDKLINLTLDLAIIAGKTPTSNMRPILA